MNNYNFKISHVKKLQNGIDLCSWTLKLVKEQAVLYAENVIGNLYCLLFLSIFNIKNKIQKS